MHVLQIVCLCGALFAGYTADAQTSAQPAAETQMQAKGAVDENELASARTLVQQGKTVEAEQSVRKYLQDHSPSAAVRFLLGYILFRENRAKESLTEYSKGAEYQTPGPLELKVVGLDYVLLGDYVGAEQWLTRSLQAAPGDSDGWYYLGRVLYNASRYSKAVEAFERCLKLDPKNVKAADNLGLAYHYLGRSDEAVAAYRAAIAWQPEAQANNPDPFLNLAILLLALNRPQEAVTYLKQAVAIPSAIYRSEGMAELEPRVHEQLSTAYSRLDQFPQARAEMEKAVQLAPENARLHLLLARLYRKEGFAEKARVELARYDAIRKEQEAAANRKP